MKLYLKLKSLLEDTDKCLNCGACFSVCPIVNAGIPNNPRKVGVYALKDLRKIEHYVTSPFNCTLCLACVHACPINLPTPEVVKYLRSRVKRPSVLEQLVDNISSSGNIFGMEKNERWMWSMELEFPLEERIDVKAKVGYFIGCNSAFSPSLSGIPVAHVTLFERAGVNYTIISNERCCGLPAMMAGEEKVLKEVAKVNINEYKKRGIKKLVTSCPACLRAWREVYPKITNVPFEVQHTTQFLLSLILEEKIKLLKREGKAVYQDPCELARGSGIMEEPRRLLRATGVTLLEFPENRLEATCCGGGGLLRAANPQVAIQLATLRLQEAKRIGGNILITACPACKQNLMRAGCEIPVLDVSELLLEALPPST